MTDHLMAIGGMPPAHQVPPKTVWTCPCGKRWRINHNHVGRACGCGWELEPTEGAS